VVAASCDANKNCVAPTTVYSQLSTLTAKEIEVQLQLRSVSNASMSSQTVGLGLEPAICSHLEAARKAAIAQRRHH